MGEELFFRGALLPQVGLWVVERAVRRAARAPAAAFFAVDAHVLHRRPGDGLDVHASSAIWAGPIVAHFTINLLNLNYISKTELRV